MFFALMTYGKLVIFSHIFLLIYMIDVARIIKIVAVFLFLINFFAIYQFFISARGNHKGYITGTTENSYSSSQEFVLDRLNYYRILVSISDQNYQFDRFVYADNFTGLIPRLLWRSKPNIGLNTNVIGRQLGILSRQDKTTSAGIGVVAESYAAMGLFGFWIPAFVYGLLFYIIRLFNNKTFTYFIVTQFAIIDTFTVVLPILITLLLTTFILSIK